MSPSPPTERIVAVPELGVNILTEFSAEPTFKAVPEVLPKVADFAFRAPAGVTVKGASSKVVFPNCSPLVLALK